MKGIMKSIRSQKDLLMMMCKNNVVEYETLRTMSVDSYIVRIDAFAKEFKK